MFINRSTKNSQKQLSVPAFFLTLFITLMIIVFSSNRTLAQDSSAPESPNTVSDYTAQGIAFQSQGSYEQAITAYLQNLTLDPHYAPFDLGVGNVIGGNSVNGLLNQVNAEGLYQNVAALERFQTRHVNSPDLPNSGITAASRYIKSQFETIAAASNGNFRVFEQPFPLSWDGLDTMQTNVVGLLPGTERSGGIIVVGAHYDSVAHDADDAASYAPGANDNASGVSAVIELARILSARQPRFTVMFVAFAAEETGRHGSRAFVNYLKEQQITVNAMFSLDIIGSQTGSNGEVMDNQIRLFSEGPNESASRQLARTIQLAASAYTPQMSVIVKDSIDREGRYSDHFSFNEAGWPAVRFIEPLEESTRQHSSEDTIDDIQPAYLMRATQTILAAVVVIAYGPASPLNVVMHDNGDGSHTLAWAASPDAARYLIALRRPGALSWLPSETFFWTGTSVNWHGFDADLFSKVVVVAVDGDGILGIPTSEHPMW